MPKDRQPTDEPDSDEYDITPDPSLLEDIGVASFRMEEAIAELIANSMDAKLLLDSETMEEAPIRVDVNLGPDMIQVVDDGGGMTERELADALRLALKKSPGSGEVGKKSEWGLGLKTASASLGRYWSVNTRPVKGETEFFAEVDLVAWRKRAGTEHPRWSIRVQRLPRNPSSPLGDRSHGTAITVNKLREPNPNPGPIILHLSQAYKPHLTAGDRIFVGTVECQPLPLHLIENSRVEVNERCGKHVITGWVGLDTKIHNDDSYGIHVYRNRQLVDAWNKDWFKPHLMTSRIMGEISLDFVPGNFHKKGFAKNTPEWQQATYVMREALKPLVRASREASRGRNDKNRWAKAAQGLQVAMGGATDKSILSTLGGKVPAADEGDGEEAVEVEPGVLHLEGEDIRLSHQITDLEDEQLAWSPVFGDHDDEVQAVLNSGSKVFTSTKDPDLLAKIALADCVAQFLIRKRAFDPARAWAVRDKWLYVATKGPADAKPE